MPDLELAEAPGGGDDSPMGGLVMGRHNRPGDTAQNDVDTVMLPAAPSDPTPPRSGRHRGSETASWRRYWFPPEEAAHVKPRRARGHRSAPIGLHVVTGGVTLSALAISVALATSDDTGLSTIRPERTPVEGRFASLPSPAIGSAPVTSGPVAQRKGGAADPSWPVTGRTPRPTPSQSLSGGAPEGPRQAGSPSVPPTPDGGGASSAPAQADPTQAPKRKCKKKRW